MKSFDITGTKGLEETLKLYKDAKRLKADLESAETDPQRLAIVEGLSPDDAAQRIARNKIDLSLLEIAMQELRAKITSLVDAKLRADRDESKKRYLEIQEKMAVEHTRYGILLSEALKSLRSLDAERDFQAVLTAFLAEHEIVVPQHVDYAVELDSIPTILDDARPDTTEWAEKLELHVAGLTG